MTRNAAKESDVAKLEAQIWRPPPGQDLVLPSDSPWSAERETAAFAGLKAALGSGGTIASGGTVNLPSAE
jgi:hypothetical protein